MRMLILTVGSRGDVQPYIALGAGLQAAGHTVTLATLEAFAPLVVEHGLSFRPLRGQFLELLQTAEGKAAIAGKGKMLTLLRQVRPMLRRMLDDALAASVSDELVIYHPKALGGYSIAEKRGIPGILALPPDERVGAWGGESLAERGAWTAALSRRAAPARAAGAASVRLQPGGAADAG
jgi:sterol 3beta-glucosyltransferase